MACGSFGWWLPSLGNPEEALPPTCKVREDFLEEEVSLLSFEDIN